MKTRDLFRLVRYSDKRPKRWTIINKGLRGFSYLGTTVNHYQFETLLKAFIKTGITRIDVNNIRDNIIITSPQAEFKYTLNPWDKNKTKVSYEKK